MSSKNLLKLMQTDINKWWNITISAKTQTFRMAMKDANYEVKLQHFELGEDNFLSPENNADLKVEFEKSVYSSQ